MEFERHIIKTAEEAATTFRAMAVCGPRQVGKTWLLKRLAAKLGGYETVSLDDEALLVQARNDPKLFLDLLSWKLKGRMTRNFMNWSCKLTL